ncbi:two component transcriptional regulator, winged helix family [Sulfobacillus acidophilus TPY]|uniref:Stage 0 sporulation protein A homolog n=1 Tax=Sulfobacillus acidophilus (strain ATCC 700253 / DSM 10332 / NAL) TaxID=679936 RepID=G8U0D0_SULAD|nr:two component transcriptional regulator, winged helix family [Sulfobacillus acidophilus TPY]AEW06472.1 two component transcriptional regulator, winged helix family [Sulfobacillus acidophilus DSM 10332]
MKARAVDIRRILVIEDEKRSQRLLRANLEPLGYLVECIERGEDAVPFLSQLHPDLVLLDLMLPGQSGFDTLDRIRELSDVPVIIISARDQIDDKVRGLYAGADDYLVKPYALEELLARIDVVARRRRPQGSPDAVNAGPIRIFRDHPEVTVNEHPVELSGHEYGVIRHLADHLDRVVVADALLTAVWGPSYRGDYGILHVTISRIRKKLGDPARRFLVTRPGVGYMLITRVPTERPTD